MEKNKISELVKDFLDSVDSLLFSLHIFSRARPSDCSGNNIVESAIILCFYFQFYFEQTSRTGVYRY